MRIRSITLAVCLLLALAAGTALSATPAEADTLYITAGDGGSGAPRIIAVDGGVIQFTAPTYATALPIAVRDTIWLADYNGSGPTEVREYTLAGVATGQVRPWTAVFGGDGATDGVNNYTMRSFGSTGTVYRADGEWQGTTAIFTAAPSAGNDLNGITYDSNSGTLWISDRNNIYNYTTAGVLLSQFAHGNGRGSLAWEPSTDTLWHVENSSDQLRQFSKTGSLLASVTVPGLAGNNWGAEFAAATPCPRRIYWAETVSGRIRRANSNGSGIVDLITGLDEPFGLEIDVASGHLYWTEHGNSHAIKRSNLDGTGVVTLVPNGILDRPTGLALDLANGHIYFNQWRASITGGGPGNSGSGLTGTHRINLDGTGLTNINGLLFGNGIDVNAAGNQLFMGNGYAFGGPFANQLVRSDLLGGAAVAVDSRTLPGAVALDIANGHVYWSAFRVGMFRSDMSAPPPNTTTLFTTGGGANQPRDLELDLNAGHIYYTSSSAFPGAPGATPGPHEIRRCNLDGSGIVTLVPGLTAGYPNGIALEIDDTPPTVTCSITRQLLWPPRNSMLPVGLSFSASDSQDPNPTIEVSVYSDEAVGSPPFAPDAMELGGSWRLRAQRNWPGNGRVYLVVVKATDWCGNEGYACCTAVVPVMPTAYWLTQVLMEATVARLACEASGTGDPGAYTLVSASDED